MKKIKICPDCRNYSLGEKCPVCGQKTVSAHPPKFSPQDKYGEYRRKVKYGQNNSSN